MIDLFVIKKSPRTAAQFIAIVQRILTADTWTKRDWYRNDRGVGCERDQACKACLEGAFDLVAATFRLRQDKVIQQARDAIADAIDRRVKRQGRRRLPYSSRIASLVWFNDHKTTTLRDIRRVLQSAERAVKKAA